MSWTHSICSKCWSKTHPHVLPVTVIDGEERTCCFCGDTTSAGIFLRHDPSDSELMCKGEHNDE